MFTEKTIEFLLENKFQNSTEWFHDHHGEYEKYVLNPMREYVSDLADFMTSIDEKICTEPKVNVTISRIARDIRFSNDKSLYKEHMWVSFRRDRKSYKHYPEFVFSFDKDRFILGVGYYMMYPKSAEAMRNFILENDKDAIKAIKSARKTDGLIYGGDSYKRTKYPDKPEDERFWLDMKSPFFFIQNSDASVLFSDKITDYSINIFSQYADIYKFLVKSEEKARNSYLK